MDRIAVLYAGTVVEEAPVGELFRNPRHPYTRGLMGALPAVQTEFGEPGFADAGATTPRPRLRPVEGQPPVLTRVPDFCPFAPRCTFATDRCHDDRPTLRLASRPGTPGDGPGPDAGEGAGCLGEGVRR